MLNRHSPSEPSTTAYPPGLALLAAAALQDDLIVATNDLERLQRLIDDAAASLMAHFNGTAAELHSLSSAATQPSAPLERALAHVSAAVTAMQFQDMATQLLAHTQRRLRHCADRLAQEVMGDDEDGPAVVTAAPTRPNPVTQDEMDAGSIELF